jgi:hypothetical protein
MQQLSTLATTPTTLPEVATESLGMRECRAIGVLACGGSVSDAARAASVNRSTIYRWLDDNPNFIAELNRFRTEQRDTIRRELHALADDAIGAMRDLLSTAAPPAIRLRAATAVLTSLGVIDAQTIGPVHAADINLCSRDLRRALARR